MLKEHNGKTCAVCQKIGNWSKTSDPAVWLVEHKLAGIKIEVNAVRYSDHTASSVYEITKE